MNLSQLLLPAEGTEPAGAATSSAFDAHGNDRAGFDGWLCPLARPGPFSYVPSQDKHSTCSTARSNDDRLASYNFTAIPQPPSVCVADSAANVNATCPQIHNYSCFNYIGRSSGANVSYDYGPHQDENFGNHLAKDSTDCFGITVADRSEEAAGTTSVRRRRVPVACISCRRLKTRCEQREVGARCESCTKRNIECKIAPVTDAVTFDISLSALSDLPSRGALKVFGEGESQNSTLGL